MRKMLLCFMVVCLVVFAAIPGYAAGDLPEYTGYSLLLEIPNFANLYIENGVQRWDVPQVLIYDVQANRVICVTSDPPGLNTISIEDDGIHYNIISDDVTSSQTFARLSPTDFGVENFTIFQPASFTLIPYTANMIIMYNDHVPVNASPSGVNLFPYLPSGQPVIDGVTISVLDAAPYYPGTTVDFSAVVNGSGFEPGSPESSVYWYVSGNVSADTYIGNNGSLTIANDETATTLEIEAVSTYDATKSDSLTIPISYPLLGSMIAPSGTQTFVESSKRQEVQFELVLPNDEPFNYTDIEWTIQPSAGASSYFRIDDQGLLVVEPNAPAGASCTVHFAYGFDTDNVSAAGATVKIVSTQEGIYDNLSPTPEQSDKAEEMEDAIGDAADKLENNNSSLGQLTPTRPQINTNLEFDQDQMLAVSPLVTNIWSINGLGRMISVVLVVATVAYIFFGKRDG